MIDKKLTIQEREVLFIALESVGIPVYSTTRNHVYINVYSYICYSRASGEVSGHTGEQNNRRFLYKLTTYEEVIQAIREKIKEEKWSTRKEMGGSYQEN